MKRAESIIKGFDSAKTHRSKFDSWLRDITFYVLPEYESTERDAKDTEGNPDRPVSTVAQEAAIKLGGNLYSYTYSQGDRNFVLRAPEGGDSEELKGWLEEAGEAAIKAIQNSNFSEVYGEVCTLFSTYGTGPTTIEWDDDRGELLFRNHPISGEIFIVEDSNGRVNGIFRLLNLTADQAIEKYGETNLPDDIVKCGDDPAKSSETFEFIHMIKAIRKPNGRQKAAGWKYESTHVARKAEKVVKESGYRTFPVPCPRFMKVRDFAYGYGVGHMAVNAICELNRAETDFRDAIELEAKPPVFTPDEDSGAEHLKPGRMIFVDMSSGQRPIQYAPTANSQFLLQRIMQLSAQIERQFFLDVFMALSTYVANDKTLGEAQMIENEKLSSIGPMVSRLRSEFWVPAIERILDLLIEKGVIGPPPGQGVDYKIVYTSRIDAQLAAINATETIRAINEAAQLLALKQQAPELDYVVKLEDAARKLLEDRNLSQDLIVSAMESAEMKAADMQAQQQAKAEEMMGQMAGKMNPNEAPEDGSVMQQLNDSAPIPGMPPA
jgi:hypothetical protein